MTIEQVKLSKTDILDKISADPVFKKILSIYKESGVGASLFKMDFSSYSGANGLLANVYVFTKDKEIIDILIPLFTTEKTTTWNFSYNELIVDTLKTEQPSITIEKITELTKAVIFHLDKFQGDVTFLSLIKVSDWIQNGFKGQNGKSVYFWNDKLPNQWSLGSAKLKSNLFVKLLPSMSDKQVKSYCKEYATSKYKQFYNEDNKRSSTTMINNITTGIYAQIKLYVQLKKDGYDVDMDWLDGDDMGVDIKMFVNNTIINIDVKSTKDEFLKISKFRTDTDFYAVVKDDKMLGYLHKFNFWESDITGSKAPEQNEKTGMSSKKLTKKWQKEFLKPDQLFTALLNFKKANMKKKAEKF